MNAEALRALTTAAKSDCLIINTRKCIDWSLNHHQWFNCSKWPKVLRRCQKRQICQPIFPTRPVLQPHFLPYDIRYCSIEILAIYLLLLDITSCPLHQQATVMPTHEAIASTAKLSSHDAEKARRVRKRGNTRTVPPCSAAAASSASLPDSASEASCISSDQIEASADVRGVRGASSDQGLCLACPYAKLDSIVVMKSLRDTGNTSRPRCWSRSYPSIPRLKCADTRPG